MMEEERKIQQKLLPWRFWFAAALTAFLVVTFILYLPLRFQHQGIMHKEKPMMGEAAGDHHGTGRYHEEGEVREGLAVNFNISPAPVTVGVPSRLDFFVNQKPGNIPVPPSELEIEHTKLMHVVGVRNDMNEFFHIHPESEYAFILDNPLIRSGTLESGTIAPNQGPLPSPTELIPEERERLLRGTEREAPPVPVAAGVLSASHRFSKPGLYKIWSQIKKDGVVHTFGHPEINVQGAGERSQKEVSFGRNVIVGNYQVALALDEPAAKGAATELAFDVHTLAGQEAAVEPYLDAPMHLVVVKDDLKQLIHAHPEESQHMDHEGLLPLIQEARAHEAEEGAMMPAESRDLRFHVTFPEAGLYKLFAQFRPSGADLPQDEAPTAAFWVKVEEASARSGGADDERSEEDEKPFTVSAWWRNLLVSAAAIVVLSFIVRRFLRVETNE